MLQLQNEKFSTEYNLANKLYRAGHYSQALEHYHCAISHNDQHFGARYNLAGLYKNTGDYEAAIAQLAPLLVEHPTSTKLVILLYCCYMAMGDYPSGCREYWKLHPFPDLSSKQSKVWVQNVEGVGDELFYSPCYLASRHQNFVVECEPRLKSMLKTTYPAIDWITHKDIPGRSWITDADLFHANLTTMQGCSVPALAINLNRAEASRLFYQQKYGIRHRVGISSFSGGVDAVLRMPDVDFWKKLVSENPHCIFFDLQQSALDLNQAGALEHITDVDLYQDFDSLCTVLSSMDSVISIDNTIANVATAMKVPTTVINYPGTHWRWTMDSSKYNWFENTKCYCQKQLGQWDTVLETLIMDLENV